jgi:endogenous inhibitor of DNA gyrase (YacG/DUF329 family)
MSEKICAQWNISLDVECPHCKNDVDLMDMDDFGEYLNKGTIDDSLHVENVEVYCPECGEDFVCDFCF